MFSALVSNEEQERACRENGITKIYHKQFDVAKENNLKNINLEIPKNKLIVFTGLSGSGKSTLAFDTLYAEGQRRYIESLSAYARQFLDKVGKPVDKTEWGMSPQTVNAYYSSSNNEIVFPAAILQPPFFDPKADPAINYGGIGAVIGHEISHHFDGQNRCEVFG